MNYFEFYNIPITFVPDEAALRKIFYVNSKKYHPDFFTLASEEEQQKALELSTLNNEAFKTLSDLDLRMKYILELKGAMGEEGQNKIPQDFLMEMMEVNEEMMELQFDFDQQVFEGVSGKLKEMESVLYKEVQPLIENFDFEKAPEREWESIKEYYFKKRYLLRLQINLEKQMP